MFECCNKEITELCCIWCSQFSGNAHHHSLESTLDIAGQLRLSLRDEEAEA